MIRRLLRLLDRKSPARVRARLIECGLLNIGRHTYGSPTIESFRGSESQVSIGAFCSISRGVVLVTGGIHPIDWVSTFPFRIRLGLEGSYCDGMPRTDGPITIGNDVWIGTEAIILSGVSIGHGAVIAARAVVTRDVPAYAVVAGMPARVIRMRFENDVVEELLRIEWWDWSDDRIREMVPLLSSTDIERFIAECGASGADGAVCR